MSNAHEDFTRGLIKGKIAEIVFERMLRETNEFTVIHFGYEYIVPELVSSKEADKFTDTVEALRTAPDFAVINKKTSKVNLIEVKYLRVRSKKRVLEYAKRMSKSWNPSYLFLASGSGFYFGKISEIIKNDGVIPRLNHPQISKQLQEKYLRILNTSEPK